MKPSILRTPVLCLCLCLLTLAACGNGKQQGPAKRPPPQVGVITAQPTDSALTRELVGRLSPYRSADVRARVPGVVLKRNYDEGSNVKQGQLLFQIDPAPLEAALSASTAALAQARATYTNSKTSADRIKELAPKGYVSKSDLDNALAAERSAAAAMQVAQANVKSARISLGYANVTAPIDGRAGKQQVTEGALVGNGEATLLTTVDQIDPIYVNFTLSVAELEQMRRAQSSGNVTLAKPNQTSVQITMPDGSAYGEPGTVNFSDTTVNPATGSVDLRATIPNPQRHLLPGMYVTLTANLGQQNKVFLIPQRAVQRDTTSAYVMTVGADGKVQRKDITTSNMTRSDWVVTSGISAGDKVIVSGLQNVKPGASAEASPWHEPTQAPGQAPAHAASSTPAKGQAPAGK